MKVSHVKNYWKNIATEINKDNFCPANRDLFFRFPSGGFTIISSPCIESTKQKTGKPHLCAEWSIWVLLIKLVFILLHQSLPKPEQRHTYK